MNRIAVTTIGLFLITTASAQTEVPHNFQAGMPARAAEVNANFDALEGAIDQNANAISSNAGNITSNTTAIAVNTGNVSDNATAIASLASGGGIAVFSQGVSIGRLVFPTNDDFWLISDKGYWFRVPMIATGDYLTQAGGFVYTATDCAGQAYVTGVTDNINDAVMKFGMVFSAPGSDLVGFSAYYVPRNTGEYIEINYSSRRGNNGVCNNENAINYGWAAYPNDEAITGVSDTAPSLSLTFGVP
jgi:hypothetical protein